MFRSAEIHHMISEMSNRRRDARVVEHDLRVDIDGEMVRPLDWSPGGFRLEHAPHAHQPNVVVNGAFQFMDTGYFGAFMAIARWRRGDMVGYQFVDRSSLSIRKQNAPS